MSQGQGSFQTNQRTLPSGEPFALNSANNGLSVDPITFKIVLGQSVGAVGDPARLLNNRQIPLNGFSLEAITSVGQVFLLDDANKVAIIGALNGLGGQAFYSGQVTGGAGRSVVNAQDPNTTAQLIINTLTGIQESAEIAIQDAAFQSSFLLDNFNQIAKISFGNNIIANPFLQLDAANKVYKIGDINASGNGTLLSIDDFNSTLKVITPANFTAQDIGGNQFFQVSTLSGNAFIGDDNNIFRGGEMLIDQAGQITLKFKGAAPGNGLTFTLDDTVGEFIMRNAAMSSAIRINGTIGFTGTVTPVTTITVDGGIVTNVA